MNIPSSLPDHLDKSQRDALKNIFVDMEILPISGLLFYADEQRVIHRKRVLPDDFLYIPKKGRLVCTVEKRTQEIGPGEFMIVEAGKPHGVTMAEGVKSYEVFALHMHAIDGAGHRFLKRVPSPFGTLLHKKMWFDKLATLVHLMGRSEDVSIEYFNETVKWLLYEQCMQGIQYRELPQKIDSRISELLSILRKKYTKNWTVTDMAKQCHLSTSRFRELFVQSTGETPKRYIQGIKLSQARSLLATKSSLSVEEVAAQVGISDAHYFHAIYKEWFGETPKKRR